MQLDQLVHSPQSCELLLQTLVSLMSSLSTHVRCCVPNPCSPTVQAVHGPNSVHFPRTGASSCPPSSPPVISPSSGSVVGAIVQCSNSASSGQFSRVRVRKPTEGSPQVVHSPQAPHFSSVAAAKRAKINSRYKAGGDGSTRGGEGT